MCNQTMSALPIGRFFHSQLAAIYYRGTLTADSLALADAGGLRVRCR